MVEDVVKELLENVELLNSLYYLKQRYKDEREYEDLQEYVQGLPEEVTSNLSIIRMTSKPFGFRFAIEDTVVHIFIRNKGNKYWLDTIR